MTSRFTIRAESPAYARRIVRSALTDVASTVVATAELLVSELVTNAMVHAADDPTLLLDVRGDRIHIEVLDCDPTLNLEPRHPATFDEHGRGLAIVDALAASWGVDPRRAGKAVWFELVF